MFPAVAGWGGVRVGYNLGCDPRRPLRYPPPEGYVTVAAAAEAEAAARDAEAARDGLAMAAAAAAAAAAARGATTICAAANGSEEVSIEAEMRAHLLRLQHCSRLEARTAKPCGGCARHGACVSPEHHSADVMQ
jgi:hypothetical protein